MSSDSPLDLCNCSWHRENQSNGLSGSRKTEWSWI